MSPHGMSATNWPIVPASDGIADECGAVGRMRTGRANQSTRRKPAPVSLCPPQIPHDLTRAAAAESRQLTRPGCVLSISGNAIHAHRVRRIHTHVVTPGNRLLRLVSHARAKPEFLTPTNWTNQLRDTTMRLLGELGEGLKLHLGGNVITKTEEATAGRTILRMAGPWEWGIGGTWLCTQKTGWSFWRGQSPHRTVEQMIMMTFPNPQVQKFGSPYKRRQSHCFAYLNFKISMQIMWRHTPAGRLQFILNEPQCYKNSSVSISGEKKCLGRRLFIWIR
jgi:hypothetical protein